MSFFEAFEAIASFPVLFAQGGAGGDNGYGMMIWIIPAVLIMMWFLMIRPQQKEQERRRKLVDSFEKHMKVYTVGGLIGTIHSIDREKNRVVLKVDDNNNTKIELLLDAIAAPVAEETKTEEKK